jgi:hypothetical protein
VSFRRSWHIGFVGQASGVPPDAVGFGTVTGRLLSFSICLVSLAIYYSGLWLIASVRARGNASGGRPGGGVGGDDVPVGIRMSWPIAPTALKVPRPAADGVRRRAVTNLQRYTFISNLAHLLIWILCQLAPSCPAPQ